MSSQGQEQTNSANRNEEGKLRFLGDQIDWSSEKQEIKLAVELPFWLLVDAGNLTLTIGQTALTATIANDAIEVHAGNKLNREAEDVLYLGELADANNTSLPLPLAAAGITHRRPRSIITFDTPALSDAVLAIDAKDHARCMDAFNSFVAFATGHLPFLNLLINSYRRASCDPFAMEVTRWDVPTWYIVRRPYPKSLTVFRYHGHDTYPFYIDCANESPSQPFFATSLATVADLLGKDELPGELEMLDGWSLYYRSRYGDSVRSFVTGIEVLLEERLRSLIISRGIAAEAVEVSLLKSRNNFNQRLTDYCRLAKRTIPGPLLNWIPYLNGVRLNLELDATRNLRHEIVHSGKRLAASLRGPMQRVAETTTWFYDWLSESDFAKRHSLTYSFFSANEARPVFDFSLSQSGVEVLPPFLSRRAVVNQLVRSSEDELVAVAEVVSDDLSEIPSARMTGYLLCGQYEKPDVELFVRVAFAKMQADWLEESPPHPNLSLPYWDKFRATFRDVTNFFIVVDTSNDIDMQMISQLANAYIVLAAAGNRIGAMVCIVNDQNGIPWQLKDPRRVPQDLCRLIQASRLSLVTTDNLARLAIGVKEFGWSHHEALADLFTPGVVGVHPPQSVHAGWLENVFDKSSAMSLRLADDVQIKIGDTLVVRLRERFHQQQVGSLQQNRTPVTTAKGGIVGVETELLRSEVPKNAEAFLIVRSEQ